MDYTIKKLLYKTISFYKRNYLRNIIKWAIDKLPIPKKYYCCICNNQVAGFLPYRSGSRGLSSFLKTLDIIGSDVDNFSCPKCQAHDRERHLFLYMKESSILKGLPEKTILHFAPEKKISQIIKLTNPKQYIMADLFPSSAEIEKIDITQMKFDDSSIDILIANHILEHVNDYIKALHEIFRVLKPGGYAILQTPYSSRLFTTWSDDGINTNESREICYGQADHVRIFGKDIFEKFASCGFESLVNTHKNILKETSAKKSGVNENEPYFLFRKPV